MPSVFQNVSDEELVALRLLRKKLVAPSVLDLQWLEDSYSVDTNDWNRNIECIIFQSQQSIHDESIA